MAANMSHRTLLDKCVAIACITMFTVSLYYWYLYVADSITDPKPPIPAKSSDVYVSAEKIGMLVAHDLKLTSVFQKAILHSDLLSDAVKLLDPEGDIAMPLFKNSTSDPNVLHHPVNQFLLLYKFCKVWPPLEKVVSSWMNYTRPIYFWNSYEPHVRRIQKEFNSVLRVIRKMAVHETELALATASILRLQEVYNLTTHEVSSGMIRGYPSLRKLRQSEVDFFLAVSVSANDSCRAWKWLNESVANRAGDSRFKIDIKKEKLKLCQTLTCLKGSGCKKSKSVDRNYTRLCRDSSRHWNLTKYTRCAYYVPHSLFIYQPLKIQWIRKSPKVFQFIDFLTNEEIQTLSWKFHVANRSTVVSSSSESGLQEVRTGTTSWLPDRESPRVLALSKKIGLALSRNIHISEKYQIGNYGIGGQYYHHHDFLDKSYITNSDWARRGWGNRLLTCMIYLSDVTEGGFTAFPHLDISAKPQKGSALVWYNLFPNGTGDSRTRHGGCPVLIGNKKIANKWIHYAWQNLKCRPRSSNLTPRAGGYPKDSEYIVGRDYYQRA